MSLRFISSPHPHLPLESSLFCVVLLAFSQVSMRLWENKFHWAKLCFWNGCMPVSTHALYSWDVLLEHPECSWSCIAGLKSLPFSKQKQEQAWVHEQPGLFVTQAPGLREVLGDGSFFCFFCGLWFSNDPESPLLGSWTFSKRAQCPTGRPSPMYEQILYWERHLLPLIFSLTLSVFSCHPHCWEITVLVWFLLECPLTALPASLTGVARTFCSLITVTCECNLWATCWKGASPVSAL